MYVTRPLSLYLRDQAALSLPPPEGPNSGILVIADEEAETLLGLKKDYRIRQLPFPQNKELTLPGTDESNYRLVFIPVLNQPLSANRYYVMSRDGSYKGEAVTSTKEEDKVTCCWTYWTQDAPPCALNPFNLYHQFEITQKPRDRFEAKSMASDGFPPSFFRDDWKLHHKTSRHYHLNEASGINSSLRARLPNFNFSSSNDRSE